MMAYMGAAVASELPSSSAYTTLQQQLQRSISIPASTYSSSAMSILQLTESPAAAAAANSSLASFSDKFLLDSSCQDSPYTPHGSHATVTSACSSYQSDGSAALSGWQALDNMQQQQLANIAAQTSPPPAAVSLQLAVAGSSSCSSSEILGSTMMSSDWQQLLDSSCNRFRISSGIEGFAATTAGGHSNRLGGGNSAVRTAGGRRGGGGTTAGAGHSSCIDSKLLNLSTAPRRPWSSLEKASCGISVEPTKGALALQGVGLATSHCLEQFSSDPAFAERAAKFSSFSNNVGKYSSQIPQPLPFVTSASDHSSGKSRHAPRIGSCSAPSRAAAPQLADSESCKISSRSSCPAAGAAASGTGKIINLQTACTSSSLSQKLETANDPMQQDTQAETDQPRDTQDPDRQLAPLLVAATDLHQDSAPVQKPELIIPPLQQQQQLEELETTGIVEAATDSDMIDVKELAAAHAGPTQEADFSSTSEQATCTTRAESSDDTARNKRKKQLHSETVKDQSHTTAAYFTESKLQQQVDDSASDQDSRAKRLKEGRHAAAAAAAAAAALEIHREDTMTMTTTTTTTTTKSATFKDILASERSSSENSGDESLSPGSTRVAGNKNKKNKQQHGTLHPSTMKNKVKALQQQPPCSEPTTSCKQDYVHVRARRGQATDSHSLAERVRREKISERMKYLQDLVPGCTKVTGKAVMLDEIINYVQSLQQQVEFLSMKLASVNPPLDYSLDTILNRECPNLQMLQSGASSLLGLEPSSNYWLHQTPLIQQPITTDPEHFSSLGTIDGHHLRRTFSAPTRVPSASSVDAFGDDTTQISTGWDGELQSILQMGFAQTGRATSLLDGFNNCQLAAGHMKVEL